MSDFYWARISEINRRQEEKGAVKYGQSLEDNTTLTARQRIEHAEEEMIDGLKYLEHLKEVMEDGITANDYQRAALRTASGMSYEHHGMLMNGVLGLCGEAGEVADLVKKATFQGHELDTERVAEELGDVAWYLAIAAHAIECDLGDILQRNVDKLQRRYPDGFDKNRSLHREDEREAWISVEDRLPDRGTEVVALHENGQVVVEYYSLTPPFSGFTFEELYGPVRYWMPEPALPSEMKKTEATHEE